MELYLDKPKKANRRKINWTPDMLSALIGRFPVTYNKELAKELHVSWRSLVRKARELGLEKEPEFLEKRRDDITMMAVKAHMPNANKGRKGWSVPGSELNRFSKGHQPPTATDPELVKRIHSRRNNTIKRERIRIRLGLPRLTKLNLK
jgi:hypothetical protein